MQTWRNPYTSLSLSQTLVCATILVRVVSRSSGYFLFCETDGFLSPCPTKLWTSQSLWDLRSMCAEGLPNWIGLPALFKGFPATHLGAIERATSRCHGCHCKQDFRFPPENIFEIWNPKSPKFPKSMFLVNNCWHQGRLAWFWVCKMGLVDFCGDFEVTCSFDETGHVG